MNIHEELKKIYSTIVAFAKEEEIVCSVALGTIMQSDTDYTFKCKVDKDQIKKPLQKSDPYLIGKLANKMVYVDPFVKYDDTRIFSKNGNVLLDLKDYGYENFDELLK